MSNQPVIDALDEVIARLEADCFRGRPVTSEELRASIHDRRSARAVHAARMARGPTGYGRGREGVPRFEREQSRHRVMESCEREKAVPIAEIRSGNMLVWVGRLPSGEFWKQTELDDRAIGRIVSAEEVGRFCEGKTDDALRFMR